MICSRVCQCIWRRSIQCSEITLKLLTLPYSAAKRTIPCSCGRSVKCKHSSFAVKNAFDTSIVSVFDTGIDKHPIDVRRWFWGTSKPPLQTNQVNLRSCSAQLHFMRFRTHFDVGFVALFRFLRSLARLFLLVLKQISAAGLTEVVLNCFQKLIFSVWANLQHSILL